MRKISLAIAVLMTALCAFSASALGATYYLDCSVASSGNGTSWGTAWKALSNITGLSPGDIVYISGSSSCSTYSMSQWNPINGTRANPIIYRVGQDPGHNSPVTISLGTGPGMWGTGALLQGVFIDGNYQGTRHMTIRGLLGTAGAPTHWDGVRLSYLTMDNTKIEGGAFEYWELDHNYVDLPPNSDHFFARNSNASGASGYTINRVHDNIFRLRQSTSGNGYGDDGFQWIGNASIYNNVFVAVFDSSQTVQHQDFMQTCDQYLAIYDNYFQDAGNYPIYGDCFGSTAHWRIYNNVSTSLNSHGLPLQHIALGFEAAAAGATLNDILIANNTAYAATPAGTANCINLGGGASGNITNSYVVNNLCYRTDISIRPGSGSVTSSNNFQGTNGVSFVNTQAYPTGDWHLQSSSISAINQGISPSYITNVYTTDKDGNQRPSGAWDVGPYEFGVSASTPPSSPTNLAATVQ